MLTEVGWSEDRSYRSGSVNEPFSFYLECLNQARSMDLLLGYFSSSAINLLSVGFAKFIYNGGVLRLLINNVLSGVDKKAIENGMHFEIENPPFDIMNIRDIKESLDEYGTHFFKCLSYLISVGRIQIKIIAPKGRNGISHYKSGLISDGENDLCFKGSCNFTAYGLVENLEEIDVCLGWENSLSQLKVGNQKKEFERLFSGENDLVRHIEVEDVQIAIQKEFVVGDVDELIVEEAELLNKKSKLSNKPGVKTAVQKATHEIKRISNSPRFPYSDGPREYQMEAYNKWKENDSKGVFAMATGTGKTITALNCLLSDYKSSLEGVYRAVIVVPTIALVDQWKEECKKFNFKNIICVSSKEKWDEKLSFFNTASKLVDTSFIVIVTYASLSKGKFKDYLKGMDSSTLLIADEAHNLGAPGIIKILPEIHLQKRIGLSATPERKYDDIGNSKVNDFFQDESPYIVSYTMEEALKNKWLCPYEYFPHVVRLTKKEQDEYAKISKQLVTFIDQSTGKFRKDENVERLLLKRKRIIHKAENKLDIFKKIILEEFKSRGNLKYSLVYVPEGIEPNYSEVDKIDSSDDTRRLIDDYTMAVRDVDDFVTVRQFTSESRDRISILSKYESGELDVLTSMKCLDEGVDVPRSELAIFCASTGNPRQFIQRRGRVLRLHNDKTHATIHDLVVIPFGHYSDSNFEMERSLVRNELSRVADFSSLAKNKTYSYEVLEDVLEEYNLNLYELMDNK